MGGYEHLIEYAVVGGYILMLVSMAWVFRKMNVDISDYFRSGCKGSWWLVGMSMSMASFTAWTFTGSAGVGFNYGLSIVALVAAGLFARFLMIAWIGPWLRQLRAISVPEVVRNRFGVLTQQFLGWFRVVMGFIGAGIGVYAVAVFASAVFGFPVEISIVAIGGVVLFYSLFGGRWAVMATDFIQSLVVFPIALLVSILALQAVGGLGGLTEAVRAQGLVEDFQFIKPSGFVEGGIDFSIFWFLAMTLMTTFSMIDVSAGPRFFSVKDGREARKAAALDLVMTIVVITIFFIPPMVARVLYAEQVKAMEIANPGEASYAIIALNLLPMGMSGLLLVSIFAATMSSLDTGLNANAAIFTNDLYPALCRLMKWKPKTGRRLLFYGQICTFVLGCLIIGMALFYSTLREVGLFSIMQFVLASIATPLSAPMTLCLFFKRVPWWAMLFSVGCGFVSSSLGMLSGRLDFWILSERWMWHTQVFMNIGVGSAAFLAAKPFWKYASDAYRQQVDDFFRKMKTPVNFEEEVGDANDLSQFKIIGSFAAILGFCISMLALLPNPLSGRLCFLFVGGFGLVIGLLFMWLGWRSQKGQAEPETPPDGEVAPGPVLEPEK